MTLDPTYAAQALMWAAVWGGLGLSARVLIARADSRRQPRGAAGKGAHRVR